MGYPMNYRRVVARNSLNEGGYENAQSSGSPAAIRGDLRRLERDQRDERHVRCYAHTVGITEEQARKFLDVFFGDVDMNWERW